MPSQFDPKNSPGSNAAALQWREFTLGMRSSVNTLLDSVRNLRRKFSGNANNSDFSPPLNLASNPSEMRGRPSKYKPEKDWQSADAKKRAKSKARIQLALTIMSIYLALITADEFIFIGKQFVSTFLWLTVAYGLFLCPSNAFLARKTQKHLFKRIHRIVFADDDATLAPGELPAVRRAVIALPWYAATRETCAWILSMVFYCFVLCPLFVQITGNKAFPVDLAYWVKPFLLITFPFVPIVMLAALLAYSSATSYYVQFFFRQGELGQHIFGITPERRRHVYIALIGYTLLLTMAVLNSNLTSANFKSVTDALAYAKDIEATGFYMIVVVWSLLMFLGRQEAKAERKLPAALAERAHSITPMDKRCPKCNMAVGFGIDICPQDGTPLTFSGDEASFGSSYEFLEEIARGGMCVIYKARHRLLKKVVAIKMLDAHYSHAQAMERFAHEARAVSGLDHPNIVTVLDFGRFQTHKMFLVMEFLQGKSLTHVIAEARYGLPLYECLSIIDSICDAMAYAHEKKILHRDLKPSNIMVQRDNGAYKVKVVDFGIAKVLEQGASGVHTKTGDVFGTPDYMSPEQCMGKSVDVRSDIYSMGCLIYETLTGYRPAQSENPMTTMYKQINEVPASMSTLRPELRMLPELDAIVMQALSKQPSERQSSFNELRSQLSIIRNSLAPMAVSSEW